MVGGRAVAVGDSWVLRLGIKQPSNLGRDDCYNAPESCEVSCRIDAPMVDQSAESKRLAAAPEIFRSRAQSAASLTVTAAAALSAAALFGGLAQIPVAGAWAAVAALLSLLVSVTAYVAASQYRRDKTVSSADKEAALRQLVDSIDFRMRIGAWAGLLAVLAFLVLVIAMVANASSTTNVIVTVSDEMAAQIPQLCDESTVCEVSGRMSQLDLEGSAPLVTLEVPQPDGAAQLVHLQRSHLLLIAEVDD